MRACRLEPNQAVTSLASSSMSRAWARAMTS